MITVRMSAARIARIMLNRFMALSFCVVIARSFASTVSKRTTWMISCHALAKSTATVSCFALIAGLDSIAPHAKS